MNVIRFVCTRVIFLKLSPGADHKFMSALENGVESEVQDRKREEKPRRKNIHVYDNIIHKYILSLYII